MASSQTTNYQLNQWEKSDRLMMTDFNADNRKIDAALRANALSAEAAQAAADGCANKAELSAETTARQAADSALQNAMVYQKISTLTLAEDTMTWTVDMSGIDLSQYAKVVIYPYIETANDQPIYLRTSADGENLMQIPTGYDGNARFGTSEMNISFRGSTVFFTQFRTNIWPRDTLTTQAPDIVCATLSGGVTHLDDLVFLHWSGDYPIAAGSQIHIYGLKF